LQTGLADLQAERLLEHEHPSLLDADRGAREHNVVDFSRPVAIRAARRGGAHDKVGALAVGW
jgi:hypothetical protein